MKEIESSESYWNKFIERKFFLDVPENCACWTDLVLEALELENNIPVYFDNISGRQENEKIGIKSFTQLLPSETGATRLEMEDVLNETRSKMMAPEGTILKIEFNEDIAWKHIFPIAVEVWRKKMINYLNFQDHHLAKNSSIEASNSEHAENKTASDLKYHENNLKSLQKLEKKIAYEYISDVEGNVKEKYPQFHAEDIEIETSVLNESISPIVIDDMKKKFKDGESINPEYFNVSTTWYEIFRAAFEKYKQFLCSAIDLKEIEEDCLNIYSNTVIEKPNEAEKKKLKFQVSDVIDSFKNIFIKAFKCRNGEKNLLEQDIGKLVLVSQSNCEKYRVLPVIEKLIQYYQVAVKSRCGENDSISLKLESLNEFKGIFSGYLECPVTESLLKRNVRRIEEINHLCDNFQMMQDNFQQKLRTYFVSLISTYESYLNRRIENLELIDINCANELEKDLDTDYQTIFANSKQVISDVIKLRTEETSIMKQYMRDWRKIYKFDKSLENTVHVMFSSILKSFDDEVFERKNIIALIQQEIDYFQDKKADFKSKISLAFENCKNFLLTAIDNRKSEIDAINTGLLSLQNTLKEPNQKTQEVVSLFEEYCLKYVEKRESEISLLEELGDKINDAEIHEVRLLCIDYFSHAVSSRKSELKAIENYIESCEIFDVDVESELSEAIDEALAGIVDMSTGMTFFHALTERKQIEKGKVDTEVVSYCSKFYAQRTENINVEIKTMEENSELLKAFKDHIILFVISVLDEFEILLNNGLRAIELDTNHIHSEQDFIKTQQKHFFSEIVECLINCRKDFEGNLNEIERDTFILKLQLDILCDEQKDEFDKDFVAPLSSEISDDVGSAAQDKDKTSKSSLESTQCDADVVCSNEPSIVDISYDILDAALEFRHNFIGTFSSEIRSLENAENKAFKIIITCADHISNMSETRKLEKEKIESVLLPVETISKTDIAYTCMDCLSCLLQYDTECLASITPDFDRLRCTGFNMEQKRSTVFTFCEKSLQSTINFRKSELDYMNSELMCIQCMQSDDVSQYITSSKSILQKGIEERNSEIVGMMNVQETLKSETEILPVMSMCKKLLQTSVKNRKEEIFTINIQIGVLEREAVQLYLVYAPVLETITDGNKQVLDNLIPVVLKMNRISQELKTEGKELIVSFKDLFLAAFDLKKSVLEKDIRKRNIEENIKMKKAEIIRSLPKEVNGETEKGSETEEESKVNNSYSSKTVDEEFEKVEQTSQETFDRFVLYYDIIKERRRSMIDDKIMNDFESIEKMLMIQVGDEESFELPEISEENEEVEEVQPRTEHVFNRVYEVKVKEIEEDIKYRQEKITGVIYSRKSLMKNIIIMKKKKLEKNIRMKEKQMRDVIASIRGKESNVICTLRDLYNEIQYLKKHNIESPLIHNLNGKSTDSSQRLKAMEYSVSGAYSGQVDSYTINENDIFPDISSFEQYVESFKEFYSPPPKNISVYEDITFRSEEILKNSPTHIPFFRKHFSAVNYVSNHVLKLLDVEITSLMKILSEMNLDKARVILHGLSFLSAETAVHDVAIKRAEKEILLDIVAVLNNSTSMLVLGSFMDQKCDISLNLDKDCSLVYFEKIENIKKWSPILEDVKEVAVDIGLKQFGKSGCLDDISTKFDWAVTTVPIGPSRFERFIADVGLLEQIKFAFLELHHHHLLCRSCNFTDRFKDFGLSFDHVSKLLSSKYMTESTELLPLCAGIPTSDDVTVASFVSKIILIRGAILTAVCLSTVLQKLEENDVTIITTSFFIQDSYIYRKMLKTFLSALSPGKQVSFIFCKKSSCGIGASIMASVANQISSETPALYLLELQQRLKNRNRLFSVQRFLKLLSDPSVSEEAVQLAKHYMEEMKFDLPLAVVWAYNFINENIEEAENIYKLYSISLSKVSHLVCRKICFSKDIELAKTYIQLLKTFGAEQHVKESAYRTLFDLLFYKDMYQEAVALIQECIKEKIPLTKLRHSTLTIIHDFCVREASKKVGISSFPLPVKVSDSSSSDSDTEEMHSLKTSNE